jgi:hypothetical protein
MLVALDYHPALTVRPALQVGFHENYSSKKYLDRNARQFPPKYLHWCPRKCSRAEICSAIRA